MSKAEEDEQGKVFDEYLSQFDLGKRGIKKGELNSEVLKKSFKEYRFFTLRFSEFPVAIVPPKELKAVNILVVSGKSVIKITGEKELEQFFIKHIRVKDKASVSNATKCWLALAGELRNDGYFKFQEPSIKTATSTESEGVLEVVEERKNKGKLTVKLSFVDGRLTRAASGGKLERGTRLRSATRSRGAGSRSN